MLFKQHKIALALCLSTTLVGCSAVVKTPYNAPTVQVPQQFQYDTQKNKNVNLTDQWWTLFNDTQLNQLVEQVLAKNSDLTVAGITPVNPTIAAFAVFSIEAFPTNPAPSETIPTTGSPSTAL